MLSDYDEASRYAAKHLDDQGLLCYLLQKVRPPWRYTGWIDARALTFPGEPDRVCDTVAEFVHDEGAAPPVAAVVEFKARPEGGSLEQLDEYTSRLRREHPVQRDPTVKYDVIGVLVNLTGPEQTPTWTMRPRGFGGLGKVVKVKVETFSIRSAVRVLTAIERGRTSRSLLTFIPLMQGGDVPGIIGKWRAVVERKEPDLLKRADYGVLALVFANLAGCLPAWKHGLEGFNVERSQVVLEIEQRGEQRGELKTRQAMLLETLETLYPGQAGDDLKTRIRTQSDGAVLQRWFQRALVAATFEEVKRVITTS